MPWWMIKQWGVHPRPDSIMASVGENDVGSIVKKMARGARRLSSQVVNEPAATMEADL
jgi:hypothetical protein